MDFFCEYKSNYKMVGGKDVEEREGSLGHAEHAGGADEKRGAGSGGVFGGAGGGLD